MRPPSARLEKQWIRPGCSLRVDTARLFVETAAKILPEVGFFND